MAFLVLGLLAVTNVVRLRLVPELSTSRDASRRERLMSDAASKTPTERISFKTYLANQRLPALSCFALRALRRAILGFAAFDLFIGCLIALALLLGLKIASIVELCFFIGLL